MTFNKTKNLTDTNPSATPTIVWDLSAGKLVQELKGHSGVVLSVAFSPDGKFIVSGSVQWI